MLQSQVQPTGSARKFYPPQSGNKKSSPLLVPKNVSRTITFPPSQVFHNVVTLYEYEPACDIIKIINLCIKGLTQVACSCYIFVLKINRYCQTM